MPYFLASGMPQEFSSVQVFYKYLSSTFSKATLQSDLLLFVWVDQTKPLREQNGCCPGSDVPQLHKSKHVARAIGVSFKLF